MQVAVRGSKARIDYQTVATYQTVVPPVEGGEIIPLFSWSVLGPDRELQRDPSFPDLPHFVEAYEMMHGAPPSGAVFDSYRAYFGSGFAARKPATLQEGTPPEILQAYRQAFIDTVADLELQAPKDYIMCEYEQAAGDDLVSLYRVATTIDPGALAWTQDFLSKNYSVRF